MVFTNFTRTESGSKIFFINEVPIEAVKNLRYYKDDSSGSFSKQEFRWSFDNNYWANWETLNQGNISSIDVRGNYYFFLEVRYTKTNPAANVKTFSLDYIALSAADANACKDASEEPCVTPTPIPPNYGGTKPSDPTNVNATTLCGESCDYYLWRPNHKGEQGISTITDLQKILNNLAGGIQNIKGENIGTGIGVYYDKVGSDLRFQSLDASGPGIEITEQDGTIYFTVDASFSYDDASINELYGDLYDLSIYIDTKFFEVDASIIRIDSSIVDIYNILDSLESSTGILSLENIGTGDASIFKETTLGVAKLRELKGEGIIDVSLAGDTIVITADSSGGITGAVNIGAGDGSIYKDTVSGNLELRTIDGSGGTTVTTVGDKIVVHSELTADTSIKNIINVGTGTGEVLAEIDSSGVAELRKIKGTGSISVSTAGDDIVLYSDASITIDPCTWSDTDPISADVGGLQGGDYVAPGTNSIEILEDILYEYFPPNVSIQIDPSPGPTSTTGYYEKWVDTPIAQGASLTYSFNNNDFTKVRVYDVSIYENASYFRTDNWGGLASIPPYTTFDPSPPIVNANVDLIYSFQIGNKAGGQAMPDYDTSTALLWTDPYFYGTVPHTTNVGNIDDASIRALNKLIVPEGSNEINYDVSANYQKIKFVYAYPASYDDLGSIFDVKNDFNVTTSFDTATVNVKMSGPSGPGPYVQYKVYIKSHWISFNPDVSIFKLNFNI